MSTRPNVLVIVTDDQRFDTIGQLGNAHIHTPNLDSLVTEGFAFERVFCTTPICTPARAELLTGCTSWINQVPWFGMPINEELTLLPQALKSAGYHTIHVGKWHNDGHPRDKGYDAVHGVYPSDNLNTVPLNGHHMRFLEGDGEVEGHATDLFAELARRAIAAAPEDRPWFCYLAFSAPHDPHESPEPWASMYDTQSMPLLPNFMPEHPFDNGDMVIRDELLENWPREQEAMRRYRCRYYSMISHVDYQVGQILGALRAGGELERTLVVFTGDQGLAIGSHGLLGKENMYDHSIASPLIYRGPGVPAGGRSRALAHHVDLMPTLCELLGVDRPRSATSGHSLAGVMQGRMERVREETLSVFYSPEEPGQPLRHSQRCLRTERWKLVWYPQIDRYQLFDLVNDPLELVDLLTDWRRRRRLALAAGQPTWKKDIWAARDPRPQLTQAQVDVVAKEMYERLLRQMKLQHDPLLDEMPERPIWS